MRPLLSSIALLLCSSLVLAHPGGVDRNGGHTDGKTGLYHVHGPANVAPSAATKPTTSSAPAAAPKPAQKQAEAQLESARVVGVHDGDTITVLNEAKEQIRIRVFGIDAPELGQDFGNAAKKAASDLLFQKTVKFSRQTKDLYGRYVSKVMLPDGRDFGAEMIKAGMAWHYVAYAKNERAYVELEAAARKAHLGLWKQAAVPPWSWRKVPKSQTTPR